MKSLVDASMVNQFFDEVEKFSEELGDVPAENIFNCDQTSFTKDLKKCSAFCRRRRKRVENCGDISK